MEANQRRRRPAGAAGASELYRGPEPAQRSGAALGRRLGDGQRRRASGRPAPEAFAGGANSRLQPYGHLSALVHRARADERSLFDAVWQNGPSCAGGKTGPGPAAGSSGRRRPQQLPAAGIFQRGGRRLLPLVLLGRRRGPPVLSPGCGRPCLGLFWRRGIWQRKIPG